MNLSKLVLLLGISVTAVSASPVTYNIDFTGGPLLPAAGSFTYDATTQTFTDFTTTWSGAKMTVFTANVPQLAGVCSTSTSSGALTFEFLTAGSCNGSTLSRQWSGSFEYLSGTHYLGGFSFFGQGSDNQNDLSIATTAAIDGLAASVNAGGYFTVVPAARAPEPGLIGMTLAGFASLSVHAIFGGKRARSLL